MPHGPNPSTNGFQIRRLIRSSPLPPLHFFFLFDLIEKSVVHKMARTISANIFSPRPQDHKSCLLTDSRLTPTNQPINNLFNLKIKSNEARTPSHRHTNPLLPALSPPPPPRPPTLRHSQSTLRFPFVYSPASSSRFPFRPCGSVSSHPPP